MIVPDPMRILLVDDCADSRRLLRTLLASAGYPEVVEMASGTEAMAFVTDGSFPRHTDIDLVLLDIALGDIDGIEVCRRIKADGRLRDTPVIMVTADDKVDSLLSAFAAGAVDYMTKPVRKMELVARVRSALSLKREVDARKAREQELMAKNDELHRALREIQVLRGLIKICSYCKKVQNDEGQWEQVELYIREHSEAEFTHGICLECQQSRFPHLLEDGRGRP